LATSKNSIIELNGKTKMKTLPTPLCASKIILAFASIAISMLRNFKRVDVRTIKMNATIVKNV
jgi:hypothetical protein